MEKATDYIKNLYSGRIGRKNYFLGILIAGLFFGGMAGMFFADGHYRFNVFTGIINLLGAIFVFSLHARRWHDLGKNGWWALILIVPMVNFFVGLYLIFAKGVKGKNEYGEPMSANVNFLDAVLNLKK
ncbi:MAG: hypothetical protein G01um101419_126 [Parcubacteria group bacterium Gr01-1014_19]|nr:MAG: hypothetical protein G01um101419_126 [Parcubacteria group bacterium Gr01-1014_19]